MSGRRDGPIPPLPDGVRRVRETRVDGAVPLHVIPDWRDRFPWLVHGTTGGGRGRDLGLFGRTPVAESLGRWRALRETTGLGRAVHARQVHGADVLEHDDATAGLFVAEDCDGHVTARAGILLTVSVADCAPISLVAPGDRRVALLHGGWRGTAAGIVGRGMDRLGRDPDTVHAHLGPAICGDCYEVGPEVHAALGLPPPATNTPVDVRAVQARQLVDAGVPPGQVTVSEHCTRCGTGFFSHRGGSPERQLGVLGIR
ncbi:MAG: laccase domain-containing protein [Gemmatimonadetes bacterium]|nr:polyphenol oxidase family protein [Gemmatimonadota bacterium]NIQ59818.1 polyphenol oxidase family protein [Gemmatimonadota bacterium]NIU80021.1 laccase domain-containing protein [Gammaproteobacteria bacterium]NIX48463.1 laccase domain-containing protein [Gemmatimonadota bacterium]NIY12900.1 laccase domain-containing protein [Gemmatimonadota bacterium]